MASVPAIPNLTVGVYSVSLNPGHFQIPSHSVGVTTHTQTQSTLEVTGGTQFSICLLFNLYQQPVWRTLPGDYVEIAIRFDGAAVMHSCIPVGEFMLKGGRLCLTRFEDGNTGTAKDMVFQLIGTAPSTQGEDYRTLLRAQQVGKIEVEVAHGRGIPFAYAKGSPFLLQCDGSFSAEIRNQIEATHYIQYGNAQPSMQYDTFFLRNRRVGDVGRYVFHYGTKTAVDQIAHQLTVNDNANAASNTITNPPHAGTTRDAPTPIHRQPRPQLVRDDYPAPGNDAYGRSYQFYSGAPGAFSGHISQWGMSNDNVLDYLGSHPLAHAVRPVSYFQGLASRNQNPPLQTPAAEGRARRAAAAQASGTNVVSDANENNNSVPPSNAARTAQTKAEAYRHVLSLEHGRRMGVQNTPRRPSAFHSTTSSNPASAVDVAPATGSTNDHGASAGMSRAARSSTAIGSAPVTSSLQNSPHRRTSALSFNNLNIPASAAVNTASATGSINGRDSPEGTSRAARSNAALQSAPLAFGLQNGHRRRPFAPLSNNSDNLARAAAAATAPATGSTDGRHNAASTSRAARSNAALQNGPGRRTSAPASNNSNNLASAAVDTAPASANGYGNAAGTSRAPLPSSLQHVPRRPSALPSTTSSNAASTVNTAPATAHGYNNTAGPSRATRPSATLAPSAPVTSGQHSFFGRRSAELRPVFSTSASTVDTAPDSDQDDAEDTSQPARSSAVSAMLSASYASDHPGSAAVRSDGEGPPSKKRQRRESPTEEEHGMDKE